MTPEIKTAPANTSGTQSTTRADGCSPSSAHAAIATSTTWRLPSVVARPAPTSAIAWCQRIRSAAKNAPAAAAWRQWPGAGGPRRRRSRSASRPRTGSA
jgi:hypothetical protein